MKQTSSKIDTSKHGVRCSGQNGLGLLPVDLHAEGREVWAAFQEMTVGMAGFEALKQSPEFTYLDGIKDGVNLYTYFPFLFIETFPELDKHVFSKLSLMSLLYVHHIIIVDALLDDDKELPRESLLVSNSCSLRALEILTRLFVRKRFPWQEVMELHRQYSVATALEKERPGELHSYSFEDLMSRLSRKSAMAKLIPLALCSLSSRREYLAALTSSFDLYYLSEQLVDDFRDWKDDFAAGRYSYLLTSVLDACGLRPKLEGMEADAAAQLVGKHMYLSGLAESYLGRAIDYCEQAKECVTALACPRWIRFLDSFQMGIHVTQSNIAKRSRQFLLQIDKYDYGLEPIGRAAKKAGIVSRTRPGVPHPVLSVSPAVSNAGRRAADFLWQRYKPGIGFEDFMMSPGQLPVWVSGYVGVALLDWMESDNEYRTSRRPLGQMLRQMAGDLKKKRSSLWAPTVGMPEDADTSVWVLDYLLGLGRGGRPLVKEAVAGLLEYRRTDGSFGTYLPGALGPGADGYYASHVEVTAVVAALLLKAGLDPGDEIIKKALAYVRAMQCDDGLWRAYWWDGQMYATYHCLRALKAGRLSFDERARDRIVNAILTKQSADGSWGEATFGKNKAFETALALKSLMSLDASSAAFEGVRSGVTWLLNQQAADGGFYSGPMLRLPARDEKEPWLRQEWTPDTIYGFGVLGRDEKRFFTTATVLLALAEFLTLTGDQRVIAYLKSVLGNHPATGQNTAVAGR